MKNIIQRGVCLLLLLAVTAALSACGQKTGAKNTIYAVEAGSAGEDVAKEKGWTVKSVQDQAAALMEVAAGTSDAAVLRQVHHHPQGIAALAGNDHVTPSGSFRRSRSPPGTCCGHTRCRGGHSSP